MQKYVLQISGFGYFGMLLGSPLAATKAAATLPGVHKKT
jgi:hypothetical protein